MRGALPLPTAKIKSARQDIRKERRIPNAFLKLYFLLHMVMYIGKGLARLGRVYFLRGGKGRCFCRNTRR
jgi:hypothetical protein